MLYLSKQKFFNYYLPMFLSVVLVVAAVGTYLILKPNTQVAEAAVAIDSGEAGGTGGPLSPLSFNHTSTGNNLILVCFVRDSTDTITGVTYNGVTMTQVAKQNVFTTNYWYGFYLVNPATGTHSVSISFSNSGVPNINYACQSYSGVAQSGQPDAFNNALTTSNASNNMTVTTVADNTWLVGIGEAANGGAISAGANATVRQSSLAYAKMFDTNGSQTPAGSHSITVTMTGADQLAYIALSIKPFTYPHENIRGGGINYATPAVVQACANSTFALTVTCNTSSNVTANDVIEVVAYGESVTNAPTISGTGSCNLTWSTLQSQAAQGFTSAYAKVVSTGSCGVTMTITGSSASIYVDAVEMSGVTTTTDGDSFTTNGNNTASYTTPSITTTADGDMVVALWIANASNSAGSVTVNSPFACASSPSLCGTTNVNGGIATTVQRNHAAITATFNKGGIVFGSVLETTAYKPAQVTTTSVKVRGGASTVETQLDTDTFNGTNGTLLPTYSANWPLWGGFNNCRIEGSPGVGDNSGCGNSRTGQTWTNDQWAELTVDSANTATVFEVCVRTTSPSNLSDGYCGGIDSSHFNTQYRIIKLTNGTTTSLVTSATTLSLGDIINMQVVGTSLILTVNGKTLLTTTDSTYSTGNPGLDFFSGNTNRLAGSWRAGSVTPVPTVKFR